MQSALKKLGYVNVHHMFTVFGTPGEADKWLALLKIKYEGAGGEAITREMFDDVLGDCDAITDLPSAIFARELIALYPEAKVILTTRSTESWYKSMLSTIHPFHFDPLATLISPFLPAHKRSIRKLLSYIFLHLFYNNFPLYGKRVFEDRNALVKSLMVGEEERFLVFEAREGWEPLCKFLGRKVPEGEYPRLHDTRSFREMMIPERYLRVKRMLGILAVVAPVLVGLGVWRGGFGRFRLATFKGFF
ncbi:NAD dependent epimerase/dehydratase [Rhexocercosporidium sp. MPI-PUGE-AT-0058]|nr:NAD dependent epimerase/dehydratase [Rhexocercosporidium sp. MPI-PUGE-AT-0058]